VVPRSARPGPGRCPGALGPGRVVARERWVRAGSRLRARRVRGAGVLTGAMREAGGRGWPFGARGIPPAGMDTRTSGALNAHGLHKAPGAGAMGVDACLPARSGHSPGTKQVIPGHIRRPKRGGMGPRRAPPAAESQDGPEPRPLLTPLPSQSNAWAPPNAPRKTTNHDQPPTQTTPPQTQPPTRAPQPLVNHESHRASSTTSAATPRPPRPATPLASVRDLT
jgi:hypothetical protein